MSDLAALRQQYEAIQAKGLNLNMKRGQPSNADFDLSLPMLTIVDAEDIVTDSGIDIRNYPGGVAGIAEAREMFGAVLGASAAQTFVSNNSSLLLQGTLLQWAMLRGLKDSPAPWVQGNPKLIVTVPGYDRHFKLAMSLGIELVTVAFDENGPDMDAVETAAQDPDVKGIYFVPTYSNPTGDSISDENVRRLASMKTAAPDFTILADDAYIVHHLGDDRDEPLSLLQACHEAGNPDRVYLFASTSKITFAGSGLGYMVASEANIAYMSGLIGMTMIGPNKVEQWRHVRFLNAYPGGLEGLMADHAKILKPKFDAVQTVLNDALAGSNLATWTQPKGGYFVSLDTTRPIADRVVQLAAEAGVALTPAGATFPGDDPNNSNIRLAPSKPPVDEVRAAMEVVAVCIQLASAEYDQ